MGLEDTTVLLVDGDHVTGCFSLLYFRFCQAFKREQELRNTKLYHLFPDIFRPKFVKYNQLFLQLAKIKFLFK